MRITEPKRPGEDPAKAAQQIYRWLYQLTEQLNMAFEQLERGGVLDLQVETASASSQLLNRDVEELTKNMRELSQKIENLSESLQTGLGAVPTILYGTAAMPYGSTFQSVSVDFGAAFAQPPAVLVSQVFDDANIVVRRDNVTQTSFVASVPGVFETAGTRDFAWVAIGQK